MTELKYCNNHCRGWAAEKNCRGHKYVSDYKWVTETPLTDVIDVMADWINNHLSTTWIVDYWFLGFMEVVDEAGQHYHVFVDQTESSYSHKINIVSI